MDSIHMETDPVYCLLIHNLPGRNQVCFSARASGLFSSQDQGRSWRYAYESLLGSTPLATLTLAETPVVDNTRILLAGTPGAVLRSEDGGQTWKVARLPEPDPVVTSLAISPNFVEDGIAFAGTSEDGVFITSNRGATWGVWNFGLLDPNILALAVSPSFQHDQRVFAGVSSGLFHSQNQGRSWQAMDLPGGYDAILSLAFSPAFEKDCTAFAGSEKNGLFRTRDGGETWQTIPQLSNNGPVNALALDPKFPYSPSLVALTGSQLMVSHDSGDNWRALNFPALPEGFDVTAFTLQQDFTPGSTVWLGSSSGQVTQRKIL
jgi:photosystem II stability/assembly factor-like uncharacterized protein